MYLNPAFILTLLAYICNFRKAMHRISKVVHIIWKDKLIIFSTQHMHISKNGK